MFEERTDNNLLTYVLTSAKLDATGHCCLFALCTYDFSLKYMLGKQNIDAEIRNGTRLEKHCRIMRESHVPDFHCDQTDSSIISRQSVWPIGFFYACQFSSILQSDYVECSSAAKVESNELSAAQQEDPCIGEVWSALVKGDVTRVMETGHPATSTPERMGEIKVWRWSAIQDYQFSA